MVMPMLPMHMLVRNLFRRSSTHIHHLDAKLQRLPRQRVVAVQVYGVALDLDDVEHMLLAVFATALQMATDLDAGWEVLLGDGGDQLRVVLAEGVFGGQRQRDLVAGFLALQRFFDLGEDVVVAAVQVDHGLGALVDDLACGVSYGEAQGDGGVFVDFHGMEKNR